MAVRFIYNWKMIGRYEDDTELIVGGSNEEDCMYKLIDRQEKHGNLVWYSGCCDEDYADGQYIGHNNFLY